MPECKTSIAFLSTICAASSTITQEGFLPSPVFLVSRLSARNMLWVSPAFFISYFETLNNTFKSCGMFSTKPLAASKTIVACSRFVARVKTSAPASPQISSYNARTAVSVDLPAFLGIYTITSVTIRLLRSILLRNP